MVPEPRDLSRLLGSQIDCIALQCGGVVDFGSRAAAVEAFRKKSPVGRAAEIPSAGLESGFVLLVTIWALSSFLDNIAAVKVVLRYRAGHRATRKLGLNRRAPAGRVKLRRVCR